MLAETSGSQQFDDDFSIQSHSNIKKPIDVAIQLDLPYSEVEDLQQEFWALKDLYDLACMFMDIKKDLTPFVNLYKLLDRNKTNC